MAAFALQDIIGFVPLTKTIEITTSGLPDVLPKGLSKEPQKISGNTWRFTQLTGQRQPATTSAYGAPARAVAMKTIGTRDAKCIHSFETLTFDISTLMQLRKFDDLSQQKMGMQVVARETKNFAQRFANLRIAARIQMLANGILYFGAGGVLLPSSSGALTSVSASMNANNINQLNGIITAAWNLTSTNIPGQLRSLKQRAIQLTGFPVRTAIYGKLIPEYFSTNGYVQEYMARNNVMGGEYLASGEIPQGLFGFRWVPAYEAFFEDSTGTNRTIWGDSNITFTPETEDASVDQWWETVEGSYPVPTTVNVIADANAALSSLKEVNGMFAYGVVTLNPPGISTFNGDNYLCMIKNPDAVFMATVAGY